MAIRFAIAFEVTTDELLGLKRSKNDGSYRGADLKDTLVIYHTLIVDSVFYYRTQCGGLQSPGGKRMEIRFPLFFKTADRDFQEKARLSEVISQIRL